MSMNEPETALVDLRFSVQGDALPLDYADALASALRKVFPWFADEPDLGVHPLGGLSPAAGAWYLSGRTRLTLRLPRQRLDEARRLAGMSLDVGEHVLRIGTATERELAHASVVYASFVTFGVEADGGVIDESLFFTHCRQALAEMKLSPRLVCGKAKRARVATGMLSGFSLMVADLDVAGTLLLQQRGLGQARQQGCGVFVPHKSMAPVETLE